MRLLLGVLFALFSMAAAAQYPNKPVRVIVGYAAGSSTDIVGRIMADRLSAYWKQGVYVETRAGAAGNRAALQALLYAGSRQVARGGEEGEPEARVSFGLAPSR